MPHARRGPRHPGGNRRPAGRARRRPRGPPPPPGRTATGPIDRLRSAARRSRADGPGRAARRTATSAIARAAGAGSSVSQGGRAPTMIWSVARPSPRASIRPSSWSASARPARVAGSDGTPARQVRRDHERARADEDRRPGPPREAMGERVVGQGPVGLDGIGDDLGHRVRRDRGRSARRPPRPLPPAPRGPGRRSPAGRRRAARAAARSATRRRSGQAHAGCRSGPARTGPARSPRGRAVARLPGWDVEAGVDHPVGQLAPDRDLDPDEVDAGRR